MKHAKITALFAAFALAGAALVGACTKSDAGGTVPPAAQSGAEKPEAAKPAPTATKPARTTTSRTAANTLAERFPPGKNCSVEAVQAAVKPHSDAVRRCFQRGLERNPELGGKLHIQLVVSEKGRATETTVREDTVGDVETAACIQKVMRSLAYAPSPPGRPCTVVYPFDLTVSPSVRAQLRERAAGRTAP